MVADRHRLAVGDAALGRSTPVLVDEEGDDAGGAEGGLGVVGAVLLLGVERHLADPDAADVDVVLGRVLAPRRRRGRARQGRKENEREREARESF